jgi:hypothetical protein
MSEYDAVEKLRELIYERWASFSQRSVPSFDELPANLEQVTRREAQWFLEALAPDDGECPLLRWRTASRSSATLAKILARNLTSVRSSLGATRARWPNWSSKPVRRGSPALARFDSGVAPFPSNACTSADPSRSRGPVR